MIRNVHGLLVTSIILILSGAGAFFVEYAVAHTGYRHLYILPLLYGVCYPIFIEPVRQRYGNIFIYIFISVTFTRYVLLPVLIPLTCLYDGRSSLTPSDGALTKAMFLMGYELVIVSFFLNLIFQKRPGKRQPIRLESPRSYALYMLFILFALGLGILFPSSFGHFSFLSVGEDFARFETLPFLGTLSVFLLVTAKFLAFVIVMDLLKRWRDSEKRKSPFPVLFSFLAVLLNISIFFGENRADYLITSIASIALFARLYPRQFKLAIIPFLVVATAVTAFIMEHRSETNLQIPGSPLYKFANTLQVYLGGPYNVAIAIEAAEWNGFGRLPDLLHELMRPVIGLNVLLKNLDVKSSSDYFNERIYFSDHVSQIMPMIGQGYFYFGFVFAPLLMILTLLFVRFLTRWQMGTVRIELAFFLMIPVARAGLGMGQNLSILMNDASFFLAFFLMVYWLNNWFVLKKPFVPKHIRVMERQKKLAVRKAKGRRGGKNESRLGT